MAAFPDVGPGPAPGSVGPVTADPVGLNERIVDMVRLAVTVAVHVGAVVRREDHQRVVARPDPIHGREHLPDGIVHLRHEVAVLAESGPAAKARVRLCRLVRRGQRQVEEEGIRGPRRPVDEADRLLDQPVEHLVDDEVVGPRPGPDEVRERHRRLLVSPQSGEPVVADVDVRGHVERRADPEVLLEAVVNRAVGDRAREVDAGVALPRVGRHRLRIEVGHLHTEVPLADGGGPVTARLKQRPQGRAVRLEHRRAVAAQHAPGEPRPPRVAGR